MFSLIREFNNLRAINEPYEFESHPRLQFLPIGKLDKNSKHCKSFGGGGLRGLSSWNAAISPNTISESKYMASGIRLWRSRR
jgi:hypothetical protein